LKSFRESLKNEIKENFKFLDQEGNDVDEGDEEYFKTWLTKILINECYKILKHSKKVLYFENSDLENSSYTDKYEDVDVKRVISKLDKDLKQIVLLYYFEDFSVNKISKILRIPAGTVKSRLYRAREVLKNELLEMENYVEGGELNG